MKPDSLPSQHSPTGDAPLPQWAVRVGLALVAASIVLNRSLPLAVLLSACATVRPDYYRPEDCLSLRHEARKAGAVRTGAGYVATGLAAGGALAEAVADSPAATVALALGAVVAGAVGLSADYYETDASREWEGACSSMPIPHTDATPRP